MSLSNQNKRYLRGLTHKLHAVVTIADKGLTETVGHEMESALVSHELVKVKMRCDREQRSELKMRISEQFNCELVHAIGQVACFYRHNPEQSKISFP